MDFPFDTIASVLGILLGGSGIGIFFTWRWQKKKARAEAKQAEAEAERAKFEAMQANAQLIKDIQGSYQQLASDLKTNLDTQQEYNEEQKQYIAELKEDRSHLRQERDELRTQLEQLTQKMTEWKQSSDERIRLLQEQVARNGRQIECMRPLLCGRQNCADRKAIVFSVIGEMENQTGKEVEP